MNIHDTLRWTNPETGDKLSWKETLAAMCKAYGTFCGRWHSNVFWKRTESQIPEMSDEQCKQKVLEIEREADADLAYWQACQ